MATDKFFGQDYPDDNINRVTEQGLVTVLGQTFKNDDERRRFFREELRKKLPELKKIEGFPIGEDDDIINLSDPPYYTACPNPWLNDFIVEWEKEKKQLEAEGKRKAGFEVKEPYASDVSEGKYNHIYFKHPYHTKVPIAAIETYLKHYTQPGDIVYDGFAGTGMSAVAAQLIGKDLKSITMDLSPIASYINFYYNYPAQKQELHELLNVTIPALKKEYGWMYETKHSDGSKGIISSIIWSDIFTCPNCGEEVNYWENGVNVSEGKVLPEITCPFCGAKFKKSNDDKRFETYYDEYLKCSAKRVKIEAMRISYSTNKSHYKKLDSDDIATLNKIDSYRIPFWIPIYEIPMGEKTPDAIKTGITSVHQLYFKRTLIVLSALYDKIHNPKLLGIITSIAFRINKRYALTYMSGKWGAGGGPTNGTYYIPSLLKELNIFDVIEAAIKKCLSATFELTNDAIIATQSTTKIDLKDCCVDYIFTDPPFGGNFIYSELNYVWESWLRIFTNKEKESITSVYHKKTNDDYRLLMTLAFKEYFRILKPGKWLSVEFSNTKASIWNILQQSLQEAGFVIANVASLDKKKGSYNAQTSVTAVKQDLVISCYKPTENLLRKFDYSCDPQNVWLFIEEYLHHLPVHIEKNNATSSIIERSPKILYDRLISYYVQKGFSIPMDAHDFQKGLRERFLERDGMFFTAVQAAEYEEKKLKTPEFVPMGIIVSDEANGIEWLKNKLREKPQTRQDLHSDWTKAKAGVKKGDNIPELDDLLEENFIKNEDGTWRLPNVNDNVDKETLRTRALLKEFKIYLEICRKPRGKLKVVRVEAVRAGFKQCYSDKNFADIILVGDRIPQNLLTEDEILLQYYDIASCKVEKRCS